MDIDWMEFIRPNCLSLLGAYPFGNGCAHIDGGVRLFICYISTCSLAGGSGDLFRKYSLERMFTNQLLENAKDGLSFRTLVLFSDCGETTASQLGVCEDWTTRNLADVVCMFARQVDELVQSLALAKDNTSAFM
ncbi:hypothetical protein DITRI_Ditri16bG0014800 [Diplodiscus trichospermus]